MTILDRYAGLVIDLDGVVLRGEVAIAEAVAFLRRLHRTRMPVVYVTNNAARTAQEWSELLAGSRVEVPPPAVLTSATASAWLLRDDPASPDGAAPVLMIGEAGLREALDEADVEVTDDPAAARAVVVGWDRQLTWEKLRRATVAIHRGARFIGTNGDTVYPSPEGPWPGNGAALAFLRAATGIAPEVAGKPHTALFELAAERLGVDGDVLVVGDQVETDVVAAQRMGWDAALVLTGVGTWSSLVGAPASPRWVLRHVGELDGPEPPVVRHASEPDLSAIRALLEAADFDTGGAARRLGETLVAEGPEGDVVGTASWELVGNAAHLRGITVADAERGHGTGSHLVARALQELERAGVEWVYLLTPGGEQLFERLGFWQVTRDRVPAEVLETAQFGAASYGASAMVRRLRAAGNGAAGTPER